MKRQQKFNSPVKLITILSGVFFTLIAWVVISLLQNKSFFAVILGGQPIIVQLCIGIFAGVGTALSIIYVPAFSSVRKFAYEMIGKLLNPTKKEIPFLAIATGVGEELLFRAVIQSFIGIFFTSLLFALSHGGLDLKKQYMISFNIFLFVMSVIMGILAIWFGLIAAIIAHTTYNIIIMSYIQSKKKTTY